MQVVTIAMMIIIVNMRGLRMPCRVQVAAADSKIGWLQGTAALHHTVEHNQMAGVACTELGCSAG
jgi:hypothetical protein